jgi:hypothetical protein
MTDAPAPRTTWEYCLSAADELVLWHLRQGAEIPAASRAQAVVVIGSAAYALASSISLEGPRIVGLPLTGPAGQPTSVHGVLRHHALSALQACPDDELGASEREQLLASYGTDPFDLVMDAAVDVITHHARSSKEAGQPHPTIRDRAPAMAHALSDVVRVDVHEARSRQQFLRAAGVIWVVYDGGLSRLPVVCGRCRARTGLTLQVDSGEAQIQVICPDRHITWDPRLTITGVQAAIALGASSSEDVDINGAL